MYDESMIRYSFTGRAQVLPVVVYPVFRQALTWPDGIFL
jgi:hypothetical protein